MKNFPIPAQKILPAALLAGILGGCAYVGTSEDEANSTRDRVVAPAGSVLRVRLTQTLDTGRNRPGDRFQGVLETPLVAGTAEVLPKGTVVAGHVLAATDRTAPDGRSVLAFALDSYERDGRNVGLTTSVVSRIRRGGGSGKTEEHVTVAADSIIGFTLTCTLTA